MRGTLLLWAVLLISLIMLAALAEDGEIGSTSTATVKIQITIPERIRTVTPDGTPIITDYANYEIKKEGKVFIIRPKVN